MADQVLDQAGQPLLYVNLRIDELSDGPVIVGKVPCKAGYFLSAAAHPAGAVWARKTNSGAAFQDLHASPIDLTAFAGETISFDFKIRTADVSGLVHAAIDVQVSTATL